MKNITLSAKEETIEAARDKARSRKTTLNAEFREWLERYARSLDGEMRLEAFRGLMSSLQGVTAHGPYSRDELNERD